MLEQKLILGILLVFCVASIQTAYAEPEFAFKFASLGTDKDELDGPTDLIMDKRGKNIYVVDRNNDRINVFEDDGDDDFRYGTFCDVEAIHDCNDNADGADVNGDGQFNNPVSIARDASGKFFVVDSANARIQIFDDDGEFQSKFGSPDSRNDAYLDSAAGIVIQESSRKILVSDVTTDSVYVFDSTGRLVVKFGSFDGNDDFQNPSNMVIDNSEEILYVADTGTDRIVMFELVGDTSCPSGTKKAADGVCFVGKFGSAGSGNGEFDDPTGLAFDSANSLLYVADTDNNRIQIFHMVGDTSCPSGTKKAADGVCFVGKFGSAGSGNGEFDDPMGIALDPTGDMLFVADSKNNRVQAFNLNTEPPSLIPKKPENLRAEPISPTSVIVSWDKPEQKEGFPKVTGYKIEYKTGSEKYKVITENSAGTATSFIHRGLDSSDTYLYRVYAINSEGTSASSIVSANPKHTTAPVALTATAISSSQIRLSWMPPSEVFGQSISGYDIKREIIPGVYDSVGSTNGQTMTYIVSDLATDKKYTFAVSAKITYGSTQESNSASATPREDSVDTSEDPIIASITQVTAPTPPIKLKASAVSATRVNLSWSQPADDGNSPITGYKIEAKIDSNSYTTLVEDTESTARTYSHTNLVTNSKHSYRVSAINSAGTSEPSNEFSVTPKPTHLQIRPIGKLSIDEGKLLSFTVRLADSSVTDAVFSLGKSPPAGAKIISGTGMFSWTPSDSDGGRSHTFEIVAKKDGITGTQQITIDVRNVASGSEPKPETPVAEPKELQIPAPFVDKTKDPQSYVDRYAKEAGYKKWFDDSYPKYDSIYQAVGLEEPLAVPAPFVDKTRDPQSYVDRYTKEAGYKKWFDDSYPEYDSIYQAVGIEEPTKEEPKAEKTEPKEQEPEKKFGFCGTGTKLIDGVCTIIEKPVQKPWWRFW